MFLHEVGVHYGLTGMLGERGFNDMLDRMAALGEASNAAAQAAYARVPRDTPAHRRDEEALGYLVENAPRLALVRRLLAGLRAFLYRRFGIGGKRLSDADLVALARASASRAVRGAGRARAGSTQGAPAFSGESQSDNGASRTAPNGAPSNLNARQHAQVRTPEFIRFFGDWLGKARLAVLRNMTPVAITQSARTDLSTRDAKRALRETYRSFQQLPVGALPRTRDNRVVHFSAIGFHETTRHGADRRVMQVIPHLPELLRKATPAWSEAPKQGAKPGIRAVHNYAVKAAFPDGSEAYVRLVLREQADGTYYYDNDATTVEAIEKTLGEPPSNTEHQSRAERAGLEPRNKLAQWARRVNDAEVSQIVDENGEPLVVYHGTTADIFAFDRGRESMFDYGDGDSGGVFFAAHPQDAGYYTQGSRGTEPGGNIIPAFLRINRLTRLDSQFSLARQADNLRAAQADGYDGAIIGDNEYVVFDPEQIKSAIGNRGSYDPVNPDIRYSRVGDDTDRPARAGRKAKTTRALGKLYDANGRPLVGGQNGASVLASPVTRDEADTLGQNPAVMRFTTRGPETTGEQGWFIDRSKARQLIKAADRPQTVTHLGARASTRQIRILNRALSRERVEFGREVRLGGHNDWHQVVEPGDTATPRTRFDEPLFSRLEATADDASAEEVAAIPTAEAKTGEAARAPLPKAPARHNAEPGDTRGAI